MKLKELTLENCEQVRQWRNECLEAMRTPFLLTKDMQQKFYEETISNRNVRARYWGVWSDCKDLQPKQECLHFIGMIGLENIEWENRRGEISIILNPEYRGKGYGKQAVDLLLEQGFMYLNLENIWGECYLCNSSINFWRKLNKKYSNCELRYLPRTKYWNGIYYDSFYFTFLKEEWLKCHK
jgi:RimJ/RimL family protein N-acetyltransferase